MIRGGVLEGCIVGGGSDGDGGGSGGDTDGCGEAGGDGSGVDDATNTALGTDAGVDTGCDCTTIDAGVGLGARWLDFTGVILVICCGLPAPLPVHPFRGEIVEREQGL